MSLSHLMIMKVLRPLHCFVIVLRNAVGRITFLRLWLFCEVIFNLFLLQKFLTVFLINIKGIKIHDFIKCYYTVIQRRRNKNAHAVNTSAVLLFMKYPELQRITTGWWWCYAQRLAVLSEPGTEMGLSSELDQSLPHEQHKITLL